MQVQLGDGPATASAGRCLLADKADGEAGHCASLHKRANLAGALNVIDQIAIIFAGNSGGLDDVDRRKVRSWESQFLKFLKEQMPEVRALLAKEKKITDEVAKKLNEAIQTFRPQFKA